MNIGDHVTVLKQVSCANYHGEPGEIFVIQRIDKVWGADYIEIMSCPSEPVGVGTRFLTHDNNLKLLTMEDFAGMYIDRDLRCWTNAAHMKMLTGAKAKLMLDGNVVAELSDFTMTTGEGVRAADDKTKTSNIPPEKLMEYIMPVREVTYSEMLIEREKAEKLPESKKTPIDLEWEDYEKP